MDSNKKLSWGWQYGNRGDKRTIPDDVLPKLNASLNNKWMPYNKFGELDVWVATCEVMSRGSAVIGMATTPEEAHRQAVEWTKQHNVIPFPDLESFVGGRIVAGYYGEDMTEEEWYAEQDDYDDREEYGEPYYRRMLFAEGVEHGNTEFNLGPYYLYKFSTTNHVPPPGEHGWGMTRRIGEKAWFEDDMWA